MNFLLDTHVVLWWLDDSDLLPDHYRLAIEDQDNLCLVSSASVWEISMKSAVGKLIIPDNYLELLREQGFEELPVSWKHADKVSKLPMHHKDPFDRLLIAQAMVEGLTLLSVDRIIPKYDVKIFTG